ncbi:serine hydroxymethyltransferase [Dactylosporangium matsuzakiense]|uniref:Serine hydroxymethyltransferase n=1 Tax=Dactylosporangium matsuzakiense TaxID=53360 RepID=A0A9W6NRB2_9ACTN|nr:serine hydroxymethyltransferase [Dactylosporangium matsuzakiense]UWZ46159.1 serine hydroxymethyltransferase [Dactylosporangium matsuzakiense]GLL07075.1 serine hydroxymethyltransferase [Dactylosporangium matsuzakiense]
MADTYWGPDFDALRDTDPEIADVVLDELARLRGGLQLIASENLTSPAVLAVLGSALTNKYAEGYPGRRYYGGCGEVDRAEALGIERAKALFGAEHANLQPHSGAGANLAAYAALLMPGDTVLAMELPHGGHLTHGSKVNFSGKWFDTVGYPVRKDDELIDYDEVRDLALQHRPKMIICGATAYPRLIDFARFRAIADEVSAYLMVDAAHFIGLVAGGAIPSPVPHADVVCATTHKVLRGPRGGMILCREGLAQRIDKAVFPFTQGGPLMHAVAAKAVALKEAAQPAYADYARQVIANARALAAGLEGEGMRPVSGGTDTHLALIDLRALRITGREAEERCDAAGITLNKNAIPYDPEKPMTASGIRVGTPSVTTQGMKEPEMRRIAALIAAAVRGEPVAQQVRELTAAFPAYPSP